MFFSEYPSASYLTIGTNRMPLQAKVYSQMLSAEKVILLCSIQVESKINLDRHENDKDVAIKIIRKNELMHKAGKFLMNINFAILII